MKKKDVEQKGHFIQGDSQFEIGKTELNTEQWEIVRVISRTLNDDYSSLTQQYSPHGFIEFLKVQVETKLHNTSINNQEAKHASEQIEKLQREIL